LSQAAAALIRALSARAGVDRDRVVLTDVHSADWQSLTFTGERHQLELRVPGPNSRAIVQRMCDGLEDAEFSIPGIIVADIGVAWGPTLAPDGSSSVTIEALTIAAD